MTRLEAALVLIGFAVVAGLALWLLGSRIWRRRQVPPRLHLDVLEMQDRVNEIHAKRRKALQTWSMLAEDYPDLVKGCHVTVAAGTVIPVEGDPRDFAPLLARGPWCQASAVQMNLERRAARALMVDVLGEDPPDWAGSIDLARAKFPPVVAPSPWANARPWAHA